VAYPFVKLRRGGLRIFESRFGFDRMLRGCYSFLAFPHPVGPWRSWERASMASRRSGVRIPPAPPIENRKGVSPQRAQRAQRKAEYIFL
jgi:hypothetical protein